MAGLLGSVGGNSDGSTMRVGAPSAAPADPDANADGADVGADREAPDTAPDSGAGGDTDEDGDQQPNVTPEEQQQYDTFVTNGLKVIYGSGANADPHGDEPTARPDILNRLKESSDPLDNLANTTAWLVTMLETSAEKNGAQLDDAVVMHGGQAMLEELATVAQAANIHDYTEKEMEGAWYRGLDVYRETATQSGRIDPEQLKQQFGEIQDADKQGRMGDVLPQLGSQADGKTPTPPQPNNQGA